MIGAQRREREKGRQGKKKGTIADVFSGGLWVQGYWRSGIESNGMIGLVVLGRVWWRFIGGAGELWGMGSLMRVSPASFRAFSGCCCVATGRGIGISGTGQRRNALER